MKTFREQFENEVKTKFKGTELLFEISNDNYIKWLEQLITKNNLLISKNYEINFDGNLKCKIEVRNNEITVNAAMNGWGNGISVSDILVTELKYF